MGCGLRKSGSQGSMGRCAHRPFCLWFALLRVRLTKPPQIAGQAGWGSAATAGFGGLAGALRPAAIGAGFVRLAAGRRCFRPVGARGGGGRRASGPARAPRNTWSEIPFPPSARRFFWPAGAKAAAGRARARRGSRASPAPPCASARLLSALRPRLARAPALHPRRENPAIAARLSTCGRIS